MFRGSENEACEQLDGCKWDDSEDEECVCDTAASYEADEECDYCDSEKNEILGDDACVCLNK